MTRKPDSRALYHGGDIPSEWFTVTETAQIVYHAAVSRGSTLEFLSQGTQMALSGILKHRIASQKLLEAATTAEQPMPGIASAAESLSVFLDTSSSYFERLASCTAA